MDEGRNKFVEMFGLLKFWVFSVGFDVPFRGVVEESGVQWLRKSQVEGWSIEEVLPNSKRQFIQFHASSLFGVPSSRILFGRVTASYGVAVMDDLVG